MVKGAYGVRTNRAAYVIDLTTIFIDSASRSSALAELSNIPNNRVRRSRVPSKTLGA